MPPSDEQVMDTAELPSQPVILAPAVRRPADSRQPYHEVLDPFLEEELHATIGRGLALLQLAEEASAERLVARLVELLQQALAGQRETPSGEAVLALACAFGQAVCRELGWGWGRVRRVRSPGIVIISADRAYIFGPVGIVGGALDGGEPDKVRQHYERLANPRTLPPSAPGRYTRLR